MFSDRLSIVARRTTLFGALFLLTAALLAGTLFSLTEPLADLAAIGSLGLFALLARRRDAEEHPSPVGRSDAMVVVLLVVASAATLLLEGPVAVLVFGLFIYGIQRIPGSSSVLADDLPAMQLTTLLVAVFLLLELHVPYVHAVLDRAALALSSVAGMAVPGDMSIGPTPAGLQLGVCFVLYVVGLAANAEERSGVKALLTCAAIVGLLIAYAIAWGWLSESPLTQYARLLYPFGAERDYRTLLFGALLIPVVAYRLVTPQRRSAHAASLRGRRIGIGVAGVMAMSTLVLVVDIGVGTPGRNVLILESAAGQLENDVPVFGSYGQRNAGMFGWLPRYLAGSGYGVRIAHEVRAADLEWADTLAIFNLREMFDADDTKAIHEFIESGGSLMLAGDHTGREVIREPSNSLLEPFGIGLNFDSAIPMREGWLNGYALPPHPVTRSIAEHEIRVNIGASLDVKPPARVIIVGRDGFSDPGDEQNEADGWLGDMKYSRGERLGDLALVAEATPGRGKVIVFGDTTSFQNPVLPVSYRFVDNVFAWLASHEDVSAPPVVLQLAALILVACSVALVLLAGTGDGSSIHVVALSTGLVAIVLASVGLLAGPPAQTWPEKVYSAPYAVIDTSHYGLGRLTRSSDAVYGLAINLMRNGYTPFVMSEFSASMIDGASILVMPGPMVEYGTAELKAIDRFVEDGGLLIVTAGAERIESSRGLLGHFGLALERVPLGRASTTWEGRPLRLWSAWPLRSDHGDAEVISEVWEYPVMTHLQRGEGDVLVVGDLAFLFDNNLESIDSYELDNIIFFREFLRWSGKGGEASE